VNILLITPNNRILGQASGKPPHAVIFQTESRLLL
jgi:hypothetical protein